MSAALSGARVVELSDNDAGALCGEFLAWYGADVVKVESPAGASSRHATSEKPGVDSYEFILFNANKRSVVCDLATERGRQDLRKLIANADVLIEHMAPGAAKRLGFDYDAVKQINPRIVFAQITGFASGSPRADYLVDDSVAQAVGGAASLTGYKGGPPLITGAAVAATAAALQCAQGVLAALYQRSATGRGQRVKVAMQEAVIGLTRTAYNGLARRGRPLARAGNGSKSDTVPSNLFACKPGGPYDYAFVHVAKSAINDWNALLRSMGYVELIGDDRYTTATGRAEHRDEIEAMVSAWCRQRTKDEVMQTLHGAGITAAAIFDIEDLAKDPHLRKRLFATVEHPVRGEITMPGWPARMSESHVPVRSAPLLGAHTEEVLSEWAGPRNGKPAPLKASAAAGKGTALSGVRVLDLTHQEAGPVCTEALAWLGADVVKVEEPTRGDRARHNNPKNPHFFISLNANKRSMVCDLKLESGRELLKKLIANVDIMIENMSPGTIERLGFDYETVRRINPKLIFAKIKGYPAEGPYGNYLCFDQVGQASGGSFSITGVDGELPLKPGTQSLADTGAGLHCASAILAALNQRLETGRGQKIEMTLQESVINFCRMGFAQYLATGGMPKRQGGRNIYRCRGEGPNDYCYIGASGLDDGQWGHLLQAIGKQDLANDTRFATLEERAKHGAEIDALLGAWCCEHDKTEAMDLMQRAGVPAGAVFDTGDLVNDPELRKGGMLAQIEHPSTGPFVIPGLAVKMSESHVPVRSAPGLGVHTEEVLAEWLGLEKQEIERLHEAAAASAVK